LDSFLPVSQIPDFESSQSSEKVDQEMVDELGSSSSSQEEEVELDAAELENYLES
jgi:hypothetical protein